MIKKILLCISIIFIVFWGVLAYSCDSGTENESKYNAPADHTVSKDGAMHKPGLHDPLTNCSSCHGQNLTGGSIGVSCYECHGKKW